MWKKASIWTSVLWILLACLCGCGIVGGQGDGDSLDPSREAEKTERVPVDVLEKKWVVPQDETARDWKVTGYNSDVFSPPGEDLEQRGFLICSEGDRLYYIMHYYREEEETWEYSYYLNALDTASMERVTLALEPNRLENSSDLGKADLLELSEKIHLGQARVSSIDVMDQKLYLFLTSWGEEWEIQHYYQMEIGMEGKLIRVLDLAECVREEGKDGKNQFSVPYAVCSTEERLCLVDNEKKRIRLVDGTGKIIAEQDLGELGDRSIEYVGRTISGIPIFSMAHGEMIQFFTVDESGKKTLCDEKMDIHMSSLDTYGNLLMVTGGKIKSWTVAEGKSESLTKLTGLSEFECQWILRNSKDEILMIFNDKTEPFLYKISDDSGMERVQIRLLQQFSDNYTSTCAAEYSRQHPGVDIAVEQMKDNSEAYLNRLAEEMKAGEGPDLLILDREQMNLLTDAGLLAPIDSMLPKELQDQIFEGVLEFGRYGGELYAVPCDVNLSTLLISEELWKEDSWTLEEAMKLFQEWNGGSEPKKRFESISYAISPDKLLYDLCVQNIENSAFLDLERQECDFCTEEFYDLLEFCREFGNETGEGYLSSQEMAEEVQDGRALTYSYAGGFRGYVLLREMLGEQFHPVGYPSEKADVSMIICYRGVAVNARSQHMDVVEDFLQFLLSEENQSKYTVDWVRRDVLQKCVKDHSGFFETPILSMENGVAVLGETKDYSSFIEEYISLLDRGTPLSIQYDIQNIVMSETGAYFAGDRSAQKTAEIIQNRVGLLLSE